MQANRSNHYIYFGVVLLLSMLWSLAPQIRRADANAVAMPSEWRVRSVYKDPMRQTWSREILWHFSATALTGGVRVVVRDAGDRLALEGEMGFDDNNKLVRLVRTSRVRQNPYVLEQDFDADKPAVVADALIPCNWLNHENPWDVDEPREYSVTKTVGAKSRFTTRIRVRSESVSVSEAVAAGMVANDAAGNLSTQQLTLVTVEKIKPSGAAEPMVKQLWAPEIFFWIYEETPSRRSYFVY